MNVHDQHPADEYDDLIGKLDLRRKVELLTGASVFTLASEESIGLAELRLSDGPTGVRGLKFSGGRTVALLPNATLLASTWSEETAYEVGSLLAEEAMAQQIHVVLGPTVNLHRSVLAGRVFETYSEDPLLSGKFAAAYVRGLQDNGVGACVKHLVANESETERNTMNSVVDAATLRELYLLPFEIAVDEADAWSVMAAYNNVNGVPATEHDHVINDVLKGEWGYMGLVVSDWFATKSAAAAARGGLDLVMPGPAGPWGEALVGAVESGEVPEAVIDDHLRRLLRLADRVGALGTPREWPAELPAPDSSHRREQLTRLAAAGMTVLTNRDDVLPLRPGARIALIGRHAVETIGMGGGSAQVNPPYQVNAADGLTTRLGDAVTVTDGVEVRARPVPARPSWVSHPETGEPGVQVILLAADGSVLEERHAANATTMVGFDDDFDETVHIVRFRARLAGQGRVEVGGIGAGQWRLQVGGHVLHHDLAVPGAGFGEEVLAPSAGTGEPEVGLTDSVIDGAMFLRPPAGTDVVDIAGTELEADVTPIGGVGMFGLVARPAPRPDDQAIAQAVTAAAGADVAVVVVGLTEEQETESVDKLTLRLPGRQDELVHAVAAAARRTVVVVNAATPVLMPWLDEVDAVLWAGLPGQEAGHAIAAALTGEFEPAGRLVTTFPAADGAAPAWSVTPAAGRLRYDEGTFIGYRGHHAGRAPAPAFWFGHGLGYTTWKYGAAVLSGPGPNPTVRTTITNTGRRSGREVVQVYLRPADPDQPIRLVGWRVVSAAPNETVTVEVPTDARMWRRWVGASTGWGQLTEGGRLVIARGLGDVRATVEARVIS